MSTTIELGIPAMYGEPVIEASEVAEEQYCKFTPPELGRTALAGGQCGGDVLECCGKTPCEW